MANQKFDSSFEALKKQWRYHLNNRRDRLSVDRQSEASLHACQQLSRQCQYAQFVLSFASFGSEINLWPLNQELATEGQLVLPLMMGHRHLQLFQVTHFDQLERHRWGILEPKISDCKPIDISLIEIALIPGLGFDLKTKHRLGYGRGYYDRLLATSPLKQKWGIGFLEQNVENLPYSEHDIPLDRIDLF